MSEILIAGTFKLHKWNSNKRELEDGDTPVSSEGEQTFAKTQLGTQPNESKLLGLKWEKAKDTVSVVFPKGQLATTKPGILNKLARIYHPLGIALPITVNGKMIYRDVYNSKLPWDVDLSTQRAREWKCREESTTILVAVPRTLAQFQEEIHSVSLHAFGDASNKGVSAAVYSVINQPSRTSKLW